MLLLLCKLFFGGSYDPGGSENHGGIKSPGGEGGYQWPKDYELTLPEEHATFGNKVPTSKFKPMVIPMVADSGCQSDRAPPASPQIGPMTE